MNPSSSTGRNIPGSSKSNLTVSFLASLAHRRQRLYFTILALAFITLLTTLFIYHTDSDGLHAHEHSFNVPAVADADDQSFRLATVESVKGEYGTKILSLSVTQDGDSTETPQPKQNTILDTHPIDSALSTTTTIATSIPTASSTPHYAYVFYATSYDYACSTLVNIDRLLNHPTVKTSPEIRIVVYLAQQLTTDGTEDDIRIAKHFSKLPKLTNGQVFVVHAEPPRGKLIKPVFHYKDVLLKLLPFDLGIRNLAEEKSANGTNSASESASEVFTPWGGEGEKQFVERMIILDADQLLLRNLDHLFALPPVEIAAPRNYWGGSRDVPLGITSTLMVVKPSQDLWSRMESAMDTLKEGEYDMDLVNRVFGNEILTLPGRYCTLNSHWEVNDQPFWYHHSSSSRIHLSEQIAWEKKMSLRNAGVQDGFPMMKTGYSDKNLKEKGESREGWLEDKGVGLLWDAEVVHFTALGKPWSYSVEGSRIDRPDAHWIFAELFGEWRAAAERICPGWSARYGVGGEVDGETKLDLEEDLDKLKDWLRGKSKQG